MDQDTVRNLLIAGAIVVAVLAAGQWLQQQVVPPPVTDQVGSATGEPPAGTAMIDAHPSQKAGAPTTQQTAVSPGTAATPATQGFTVVQAEREETLTMGAGPNGGVNKDEDPDPYRMRLTLSNVGASVESATMTDHAETVDNPSRYALLRLIERDDGSRYRSLAVDKINVDDVDLTVHDKKWNVEPVRPYEESDQRGEAVEFWIEIQQDDKPALKVTRTLMLPEQSKESGRHDLWSKITVENLSEQPHQVVVTYLGGLGIRRANERIDDRYFDVGIRDSGFIKGNRINQSKAAAKPGEPIELYSSSAVDPGVILSWGATANVYFTCTIAPLERGGTGTGEAGYISSLVAFDADGSRSTDDDATLRFVTTSETIQPSGSLDYPAAVYLGKKDARTFKTAPDYRSRDYYYQIRQGYGWCTFTWLVELMIWLLNSLFFIVRDFGVAIIILVLVVRTLLHPITKKGQVNMVRMQQRMQEMAPKIEEIKKKYANDKARMNQEMMKLNINPAGQLLTCLPMMIQMPIWIALYLSLSNNILMRHQGTVIVPWIKDLTAQDALWTFSSPVVVPFFNWVLPSLNVLPILVAVFMYTQQKLQPKPAPNPNMTDQQRQQQDMMQKMMPMMSIMMLLIFYKMPSGLNLYIMSSSLFGTIEQKRIRTHIKEREAAGTLHKPDKKSETKPGPPEKRKKPSFMQRLQGMAEDAQKAKSQGPRAGKRRR